MAEARVALRRVNRANCSDDWHAVTLRDDHHTGREDTLMVVFLAQMGLGVGVLLEAFTAVKAGPTRVCRLVGQWRMLIPLNWVVAIVV